ncbi:hypothetical protein D7X12_24350 [Corallococcus sicarius]|uniref:Uncharacterized protein n=1 Tax=Corallococcus sicarius TaxID=2316726 RepID=A0A3A8N6M0_9BACT|nr:hypothetical protein D7X12_24350 [Corallococcus sicarius]
MPEAVVSVMVASFRSVTPGSAPQLDLETNRKRLPPLHRFPVRVQEKRTGVAQSALDVSTVVPEVVDVVVNVTAVPVVWATAVEANSRRAARGRRMDGAEG